MAFVSSVLVAAWLALTFVSADAPSRFIFATGDSYTQTGFNASLSPQPSTDNPFGNPAYPGVTYTGGANWIDVMVSNYSPPGTVVYNYAVGSNPVNLSAVNQDPNSVQGPIKQMLDQEHEWELQAGSIGWRDHNALFINWFGINDINSAGLYANRSYEETLPTLDQDIDDFFSQVFVQYEFGVRKFLTVKVIPLERTPVWTVGDPSRNELARNLSMYWNQQLEAGNEKFAAAHPDAEVAIFDPAPTFASILDNYQQYGAPNNTCISYPDGQPCLWHDFIHGGIVISQALGRDIGNLIDQTFTFS